MQILRADRNTKRLRRAADDTDFVRLTFFHSLGGLGWWLWLGADCALTFNFFGVKFIY